MELCYAYNEKKKGERETTGELELTNQESIRTLG